MDNPDCAPTFIDCKIKDNSIIGSPTGWGGGICVYDNAPSFINCEISGNESYAGGGVFCSGASPSFSNCVFNSNSVEKLDIYHGDGGAVYSTIDSSPTLKNCLIYGNSAERYGGAFFIHDESKIEITNCTIADNSSPVESLSWNSYKSSISITNSILWNNNPTTIDEQNDIVITYSDVEGGFPGEGNIDSAPLFLSGPWGDYYLSQKAAGQTVDSPCIDSGCNAMNIFGSKMMTTRVDGLFDYGTVDMGFHYLPHIQFNLFKKPEQNNYASGDNVEILFDLKTAPTSNIVDIYLIMINPSGQTLFAPNWTNSVVPLVADFMLSADIFMVEKLLFDITLPSSNPPVDTSGSYMFNIAAFKAGTTEMLSDLASVNINVQDNQ
jgi:hypothetical protein